MKRIETNTTSILKNSAFTNRLVVQVSLTLIFALITSISLGQKEDCKTIEGTFKNNRITGLNRQSVNHDDNYKIHLKELNTALYKVQFKFNDFDWETETPSPLSQLLPGVKNYVGLANSKSFNPNADNNLLIKSSALVDSINKKILLINETIDSIQKLTTFKQTDTIKVFSREMLDSMRTDPLDSTDLLFLAHFQNDIAYIKGLYSALKEFNAQSLNGKFEYVQLLASLEGTINQLNSKNYPKLLSYVITFAKETPKYFKESDIHFPEKEVTSLQIIIINRFDPSDTICNYSTDIYRTGIFKIDFSTGIGVNSLVKPTYSMGNNGSPYIHKENGRDADLSVMALLHANWRLTRNFTFGPTAGVSVSTFDANTGFVLGVSGSFGTRNTISVSAGGIMGKSFKLSSRVSSDGNVADIPLESGITEIPKVDAVNYGWFVSVTYNLTRIKKKP